MSREQYLLNIFEKMRIVSHGFVNKVFHLEYSWRTKRICVMQKNYPTMSIIIGPKKEVYIVKTITSKRNIVWCLEQKILIMQWTTKNEN